MKPLIKIWRYLDPMKCSNSGSYCQTIATGLLLVACVALTVLLGLVFGKLRASEKKMDALRLAGEQAQETFFYEGYDKGYQSAVVDAYLGSPLYMIEEVTNDGEGSGGVLWKKVELDDANRRKLEENKAGAE